MGRRSVAADKSNEYKEIGFENFFSLASFQANK
jgi:hypothetical protein